MSAAQEGRSEKPTQKQKDKFRDEGQVARSIEVNTFAQFFAGYVLFSLFGIFLVRGIGDMMRYAFERLSVSDIGQLVYDIQMTFGIRIILILTPLFAALWVAIVAINVAQFGFRISWKSLEPKWEKLNPVSNLKNILFSMRTVIELVKSVLKIAVIGYLLYSVFDELLDEFGGYYLLEPSQIGLVLWSMVQKVWIKFVLVMFVLGAADGIWQRYSLNEKMKMTPQQVQDEMKQTEGDPHVKSRQRAHGMQFLRKLMLQNVSKADVVITNPTHFAVALAYDRLGTSAPTVVAKGVDVLAFTIRKKARHHTIPIVENRLLARALYYGCEIGTEIPEHLFRPVAEILAFIYRLEKERSAS